MTVFEYRKATIEDLEKIWDFNIAENPGDERWVEWKEEYIGQNRNGLAVTFVVVCDGEPIGEGTLLISPECGAERGRLDLVDGKTVANVNALRIKKAYEGQGHISKLVKLMEKYAADEGYERLTIGVDASETRNLGIYLHWGYDKFVLSYEEDGELVLYYAKKLK